MRNSTASSGDDWTILKLLEWTTSYFTAQAIEGPRAAAEILLAHVLTLERVQLYLRYDQPLMTAELEHFKTLIRRRVRREPVAYITGRREFWSMDLAVSRDVLIPRPETECLVEQALARLSAPGAVDGPHLLDLGTGSGAIILALAAGRPRSLCVATDVSERSLRVAQANARRHELEGRIHFLCGDWLRPLRDRKAFFDMIVSNPPYIPSGLIKTLAPEIHAYEPARALDGGEDGLACMRRLIAEAPRFIRPGGYLMLEIGHDQAEAVRRIVTGAGPYEDPVFARDYGGHDRVAALRLRAV
ncbi:MAG: peptide chain release factor N(5)-glutamine methyltransferase [Desulfobacterales bacterium]